MMPRCIHQEASQESQEQHQLVHRYFLSIDQGQLLIGLLKIGIYPLDWNLDKCGSNWLHLAEYCHQANTIEIHHESVHKPKLIAHCFGLALSAPSVRLRACAGQRGAG